MGIFNKLKFWERDQPDLDILADQEINPNIAQEELNTDATRQGLDYDPMFPENARAGQFQPRAPDLATPLMVSPSPRSNPELELIASKLDTIKAMLDSMERRVANIEKSMGTQEKQRLW